MTSASDEGMMSSRLEKACERFVRAVFAAKQQCSIHDDFFAERGANNAYDEMFKAIRKQTPADVEWQFSVLELAGSLADAVWEGATSFEVEVSRFTPSVLAAIEHLSGIDWIASVPLERAFQQFPEFTHFGQFAIANARAATPRNTRALLTQFRRILSDNFSITFLPTDQIHNSYLRLDNHYYKKSGDYIPGRPQLIVKLGKGERFSNERLLKAKLAWIMPLVQLCQIVLDLQAGLLERVTGPHSTRPDGKTFMEKGLISVPQCCLALNKRTGEADWWNSGVVQFETRVGIGHDPDKFAAVWQQVAVPIFELADTGAAGKVLSAVVDAVRMLASGRHLEAAVLGLNAVIATETILSPFGGSGDISERFSLLAAALTESEPDKRRDTYRLARELYRQRCHAVHRSRIRGDEDADDAAKHAVALFIGCLSAVVRWAKARIDNQDAITREAFEEFYINTVVR